MSKNTTVISITGNIRASILALDACANQSVVGILENEIFKSPFIYQNMLRLLKHYTSISTGNCQKHISKGAIEELFVCIPDSIVLKQYYSLSEPIYKQMHEIALENQHLTELRDWLLPMLMNGQRHFVLGSVFVADKEDEIEILNKYRQFKNRFGFTGEIKGSELMTQRNNEALKYFITNVLDDKHFFICNYDKIFYLSTLISVYIFGVPFQQQETLTFYMMASALAGEKEELFLHYCSAVCENTDNSKKEFLEYLISFPYEKLDRNDYNLYIAFAKLMLENKDYGEFTLTYEAYSCKNTVNFVNMTALGELLLSLKHLHGVDMSKTEIYHDNLMGYEEEYNQSFEDNKIHINFVDSKENELVQLADNISSIYRKCFEKSFEAFRCNKQWTDNIWFTENYSRIINTIGMEHIKMDTPISDYVLPFVIRDIFGNEYGQFEQNKEKFGGLFYFYKERIMEDIDAMKVDLPL